MILHIVDEPYDSGIVQYALRAAAGLAGRGLRSALWGLEGGFPVREAERLGLDAEGYTHPWLSLPELRRRLRASGAELLVAHTGSAHSLGAALAAWGSGTPLLRVRGDARTARRRPGRGLLWRRTAGFIAANGTILAEHRRLHGDAVPAEVIYEGAPDPGVTPPPAGAAPTVGIVARLDPVKGHADFLAGAARTLRECPDARFLIVGREENVPAARLLAEARRLGVAARVELTGRVPDATAFMRRCHAGVIASIGSEAVSRAAVEWMSLGRPLVATRVGCLPEYVEDGVSGILVPPRDPEALGAAVARLVRDPFLRERMGRAARERYERLFTLERFLDRTVRFYEHVQHAVPRR